VQSGLILRRCQEFRYDVLLADSKMTTSYGSSAAYCDIHHVSRMASFIGWCQSTSTKMSIPFSSTTRHLCLFFTPNLKIPYTIGALDWCFNQSHLVADFFPLGNPNEKFLALTHVIASSMKLCWLPFLNPTLMPPYKTLTIYHLERVLPRLYSSIVHSCSTH
jgi:hypothetical protein